MHLLPREDAHERLFDHYAVMLQRLAADPAGKVQEADLRRFEKALLQELGYGLTLGIDQTGQAVEANAEYSYQIEHGPQRLVAGTAARLQVSGQSLLDLAAEDFTNPRSRAEAKSVSSTHLDVSRRQPS